MQDNDNTVERLELPLIQKIVEDETWLEAERRNCPVDPEDSVVRENVCNVIIRVGEDLRQHVMHVIVGRR